METTIKLTDEIQAAACQLARIALRQDQGSYRQGYVQGIADLLAVLNVSGDLPAAAGSAWNVHPDDALRLPGNTVAVVLAE